MPELLLASGMLEVCYINLINFLFFFFCFFSYKWFCNLHFLAANLFAGDSRSYDHVPIACKDAVAILFMFDLTSRCTLNRFDHNQLLKI